MGGLFEFCFRPSQVAVAPEPAAPLSSLGLDKDSLGNDLGVKQPLAERKLVLSDAPTLGSGLLPSMDVGSISPSAYGSGVYAHTRSRTRRQSVEAGDALSTTLEMARQRRLSSTYDQTSTSSQSGTKGLMNWSWLKAKQPKGSFGAAQQADQALGRGQQRLRENSFNSLELLQRRGFPVHYAKDIHKSVSTSTTKPIAVLGLEPSSEVSVDDGGMEQGKTSGDGSPDYQSRRNHNKLFPLYVNGVAKTYFKISASRDYAQVLRRLLRRDPLLTFALQKAIKNLSVGECKPVSHVTSDPTGASASLYGLRITPCVWSDTNGHKLPALLLEHNVPYESQDVMPRLLRDYAVLSHVPSILTLIDFNGHVLYQNAASIDYSGDLTSHNVESGDGMLGVLFQYEPQLLQEMLQEVNEGNYWQQVVRVPGSLKRHMVFEAESTWSYGSRGSSKKLTAAVSKRFIQDALEPEFQLESFTTQNARSQRNTNRRAGPMFQTQQSMGHQDSMCRGSEPWPRRQDTRDGVAISGPAALPVGRLSSVTGTAPRLGSNTMGGTGTGTGHVAFNLPNQLDDGQGSNSPMLANGASSFSTAAAKAPAPTQHSHLTNPGQNRRFMTLMQSAAERQPPSFTASMQSFNTDGDKPESRQGAMLMEECWHDISAIPLLDPVLDKQVILLLQTNVTARVELENRLADLTDAQLGMLEQLFPRHVIEYMLSHKHGYNSRNLTHLANHHEDVIVLFTDVVGFTSMSKEVEPSEVMHFLNELYTIFDDLVDLHDLYKLDTVGDCYIVVAGLTMQDDDGFTCTVQGDNEQRLQHAQVMMDFAKAILRESKQVLMPHNHSPVQIRIGIHLGSLASGLVGPKMPKFTLFGDTMNTASRMESTCKPGCVQVSEVYARLLPLEDWQDTGGVEVKGKGHMQTFLWIPKPEDLIPLGVAPGASGDGASEDSLDQVQAPAASAAILGPSTAPDDSAGDHNEAEPAKGPLPSRPSTAIARPKSSRPFRPKSSRPKSSRYLRPTTGRLRERDSRDGAGGGTGGGGVMSRPSTASSHGGLGRTLSTTSRVLGRSMSRRNVSFRFREDVDDVDGGTEDGSESTPFMAILNAIRGSGTGDGSEEAEVQQRTSYTPGPPVMRNIHISSDGDEECTGRKSYNGRSLSEAGGGGILASRRISNGYPLPGPPRLSNSGLPPLGSHRYSGGGGGGAKPGIISIGSGNTPRVTVDGSAIQIVDQAEALDEMKSGIGRVLSKGDSIVRPVKAVRLAVKRASSESSDSGPSTEVAQSASGQAT